MRQLRLVHLTDDGTALVLESGASGERFGLPVDAVLRDAVRAERPRPVAPKPPTPDPVPAADASAATASSPAAATPLGPREIQMRVRAGASPEEVAQSHGLPVERVLRFATAVVDERLRIADEARRARARRTTTEGQVVVFGEAVDERFAAHGIAPEDVRWDARRPDGDWLVLATWNRGEDEHVAEWVFHRGSRTVTPVDDAAIDLLSDRPIRPAVPAEPTPVPPPFAPGVFVFPPMPDAATGPVPRITEDVFDQEAPPEGPIDLPPLTASEPEADRSEVEPSSFDEPPLPLGVGVWSTDAASNDESAVKEKLRRVKTARRGREDGGRPRVPSWDDILLGVRRESE